MMPTGSGENDDLSTLADAAAAMAVEMVTKTVGEKVGYRPSVTPGVYVPMRVPGDVSSAHLVHL